MSVVFDYDHAVRAGNAITHLGSHANFPKIALKPTDILQPNLVTESDHERSKADDIIVIQDIKNSIWANVEFLLASIIVKFTAKVRWFAGTSMYRYAYMG